MENLDIISMLVSPRREILSYVRLCANAGCNISKSVIEHGIWSHKSRLPRWADYGTVGYCFHNALSVLAERDDVTYVEGFAFTPNVGFPLHHAWLMDDRGVIELTWKNRKGVTYFGVPIKRDIALDVLINSDCMSILDNRQYRKLLKKSDDYVEKIA